MNAAARLVGRELIHYDFDQMIERGIVEMGRHCIARPLIRGAWTGDDSEPKLRIGHFCGIAEDAEFLLGTEHRTDRVTTFPLRGVLHGQMGVDGPYTKGETVVGNDVWIGYRATIASGVTIGNGAVVATRAMVAKDVRPYAIVAGNPAREIRRRFTDEQIEALEKIAWWDWPDEEISEHADLICSEDVDAFIARFL
ncbi:MAG: antibiotic acetyltransferase [Actinobacteria bacterium]|nr:antibiotic acetyltransferase [Actinomycetota bacterium]